VGWRECPRSLYTRVVAAREKCEGRVKSDLCSEETVLSRDFEERADFASPLSNSLLSTYR
jgi:hypothetical protein